MRIGPYGADNYALMEKLKEWAKANGLFTKSAVILGISQDNPKTTPPENCRYDVCIVVPDDYAIADADVNEATLPSGKYAEILFFYALYDFYMPENGESW